MKIFHALYYNGISYGIPEGTKVPEKPFPKSQCYHPDCDPPKYCNCDEQAKQYADDLQALLSVSIQWEDQAYINAVISQRRLSNLELQFGSLREGGIYPLLGVEAEAVWQRKSKGAKKWNDTKLMKMAYHDYRQVLRLIPQPNSAHSFTEGSDIPAADENYDHCPRCGSTENGHVTYGIDCNPPSAKSNRTSLAQQIAAVEEIAKYEIKGTTKEDGKLFKQALQDAANSLLVIADLRALNESLWKAGEANTNSYKELLDKI